MFDIDGWQEIVSTLRRNLLRTTLTAVGVFWGVLMLMIMVGFGNGLEGGVKRDMEGLATKSLFVWGQKTSLPHQGNAPGKFIRLTRADAAELAQNIPDIEVIAPRAYLGQRGGGQQVTRGSKSGTFNVVGEIPEYVKIQPETIVHGRPLNELDLDRKRKVVVIGTQVAAVLFAGANAIGETIQIKQGEFTVVGVFKSSASGDQGDRMANTVHVPLSTFQKALRPEPWVHNFAILVRETGDTAEVDRRVHEELARLHHYSPEDKEAIGSWNAEEEFEKIGGLFTGISALIGVVGVVTLLAGIIGVSNIMMISVRERTKEIGIRRAIGATPWSIVMQILKESTLLTTLAGYLGLATGVAALELIGKLMEADASKPGPGGPSLFEPPHADFRVAIAATAVVILGGAIAGMFPALHAIRIPPVVALRDE